jgi:hypothetical protein
MGLVATVFEYFLPLLLPSSTYLGNRISHLQRIACSRRLLLFNQIEASTPSELSSWHKAGAMVLFQKDLEAAEALAVAGR